MTSAPLNKQLLRVIIAVQAKKELSLAEMNLDSSEDWFQKTEQYFFEMPDDLIERNGLVKNRYCFEAVLGFDVSKEVRRTKYTELGKFKLVF